MIAVRYNRLTDTRMYPLAETWRDLCTVLSQHREIADKFDGELWSPIIPTADGPNKRCNAAVAAVSAVVLDVDDGTPLETMVAALTGEWIAYSTWSHTTRKPRYHVVLQLPEPIPGDVWNATYERVNGHRADWLPAISHAYFLPAHARGKPWFVTHS